jgi:hypothetical protein
LECGEQRHGWPSSAIKRLGAIDARTEAEYKPQAAVRNPARLIFEMELRYLISKFDMQMVQ